MLSLRSHRVFFLTRTFATQKWGVAPPRPNPDLGGAQVPPRPTSQTPTDLGGAQVILVGFCVAKAQVILVGFCVAKALEYFFTDLRIKIRRAANPEEHRPRNNARALCVAGCEILQTDSSEPTRKLHRFLTRF